jgi:hypothetical protein
MLSFFNPLFIGGVGVLSLIAFSIWQFWFNPDLTTRSQEKSESEQGNQQVSTNSVNSNPTSPKVDNPNSNQTIAPESSPNNSNNVVNNPNVAANPTPEIEFNSVLSQSNPTPDIFKSITPENNRQNQESTTGAKLYEQLKNLPDLFPELLPAPTVDNGINPLADRTLPRTQTQSNQYRYELRENNASSGYGVVTTPLGEAVNRVMANTSTANTQSNAQQTNVYNPQGTPATIPNTPISPYGNISGAYGSNSAYGNYGATTGTNPYPNNYGSPYGGAPNGIGVSPYTNNYGGAPNGIGVNPYSPYNRQQVPPSGYNSGQVSQPGFPNQYGF